MKPVCRFAKLADSELRKVRELEKSLGIVLLAVQKPPVPAKLSKARLKKLQQLEKELGAKLVAYK